MREARKVYENYQAFKKSNEKNSSLQSSWSSLDKYNRSPYLQRVIHNGLSPKRHEQKQTKNEQKQYEEDEIKSNKQPDKQHRNYLKNYQLPKIKTLLKHQEGQITNYIKPEAESTEQFLFDKQKLSVGSHSATLEVTSKKKRLDPIHKPHNIQAILKTKAGTSGKQTKINQDIGIMETKLPFDLKLYCICDGHGVNGHLVSAFIKTELIKNLHLMLRKNSPAPELEKMKQILNEALMKTNHDLLESEINTELSGSTVVASFIYHQNILTFNIGDSRAILIQQLPKQQPNQQISSETHNKYEEKVVQHLRLHKNDQSNYHWKVKPLSIDQKPERQDERQRIIQNGGRVFCQKTQKGEDIGPLRVWMKDVQMPGLAMTRSFGDKAGIKAGTNGESELIQHQISEGDRFLIVASDGVWEYLENEEVMQVILPFYLRDDLDLAGEKVIKVACQIWQRVSLSRDDITIIIVSLNAPSK